MNQKSTFFYVKEFLPESLFCSPAVSQKPLTGEPGTWESKKEKKGKPSLLQ
jgi:hypothetical protein